MEAGLRPRSGKARRHLAAGHRQPNDLWPVRLLQGYLSDLLNLIFPPEDPTGPEAIWPWWKLGWMLGVLGVVGYLALSL